MAIKVMLVDDSAVVRGLIARALAEDPHIEIVATAGNGEMAVQMVGHYAPDVIILDIEMPVMDGMTALPKLLEKSPSSKIIMASTLTVRNAGISLEALSLGASDYLAKPSARDQEQSAQFYRELIAKIKALGGARRITPVVPSVPQPATLAALKPVVASVQPGLAALPSLPVKAVAIASSTGGPQALQVVFTAMRGKLAHVPVFITQHMPPTFTTLLAEHLTKSGERLCTEAVEGELAKPGQSYLAPGNFHMTAEKRPDGVMLHLNQDAPENFCRPAADPMLRSLSAIYGTGLLVVVLTGMGQDGFEGAKVAVNNGGVVIAQDEASCVVWGMPRAVTEGGVCKAVLSLADIAPYLIRACGNA